MTIYLTRKAALVYLGVLCFASSGNAEQNSSATQTYVNMQDCQQKREALDRLNAAAYQLVAEINATGVRVHGGPYMEYQFPPLGDAVRQLRKDCFP